jgi:hypothetical protein
MWEQTAVSALRQGKCLQLSYDGFYRIVEVHCVGYSTENHGLMRVYQVRGGSESNEPVGWKMMRLDEGLSAHVTDEKSQAPRTGYKRNDKAMKRIIAQV